MKMISWYQRIIKLLKEIPIQVKIYGMVFFVIITITALSLIEIRLSMIETLSTQLEERVKSVGRDVAVRSGDLLLTQNVYLLHELAQETVKNNPDIEYVFMQDEKGKVIVHTFGEKGISQDLVLANQVNPDDELHLQKFMTERGVIRDVAIPIIQGVGGTVRVGITEESLNQALRQITANLIFTMIIVLLFAGIISFLLTRLITTPITQLLRMTKEVSKGNLSIRVKPQANDEIGLLTNAFNQMLSDLEEAEKEKRVYVQKITFRNRELSLLNELSGHITSVKQMKAMLEHFVMRLVEELDFNSCVLKVEILDNWEFFKYFRPECSCMKEIPLKVNHLTCYTLDKQKHHYEFTIKINEKIIGRFDICSCRELDEQSINILESLSNQLAVSLENMQLWHELKQKEEIRQKLLEKSIKAQEEERKRIARELHDETSQSLTSILLGLSMLNEQKDEQERVNLLQNLKTMIQHTLKEVHEMAWQLRPSVLDKFGLTVALERYIEEYQHKYAIDVDLYMDGIKENRMQAEIEIAIYRIIQEALTNVARYAQSQNVSVIIDQIGNLLSVIVEDDGIGFNVDQVLKRDPSKYNLGLHGMQERASLIGGTITIESKQGKGTTIFLKVPLSKGGALSIGENQSTAS
ncbi:ATP-binding protein [Tepidibacillus sp. HK-1]|uniref:sensor histidine kinase n=1 Tax=Tepidibacillus sp. HK-1 TaxID=1883407 RepID=UPI000853BB3F|nr:ATP-binding protein [Tepidibacillus sp. HK-1]GBF10493.1 oxygen sensor histidine kinase NreB [Tepidibacillus sp. HK-1]